jgi:hypothetical protein
MGDKRGDSEAAVAALTAASETQRSSFVALAALR